MNLVQALSLAMQQHQGGNLREAEQLYRQILQAEPHHADALHLLGVIALQVGRQDLAIQPIRAALRASPKFAEAHCNLGLALQMLGQLEEAIIHFQQALALKPQYAEAHFNLGITLQAQGKLEEAIANYQQALRLKPEYAPAYNNLANALREQGKFDEAIINYQQALLLNPDFVEVYNNLGNALKDQGKLEEAITSWRQALRLRPDLAEAHNNLGNALKSQGKLEEAVTHYQQALRLNPNYSGAYNNLANALKDQGKLEEAAGCFERALSLEPDNGDFHFNRAMLWLLQGDFEKGWNEYEWRWQTKHQKPSLRHFGQPPWQGNPLPKGTILLHCEHGLGDILQFIRFAALIKERVGNVLCECPAVLVRLLQSCEGIDKIVPSGEPLPYFDVHIPLMSLPRIFKTTLSTIPANIPYIHAKTGMTEAQARVLGSSMGFKIGVVWQGNPKSWDLNLKLSDARRSFPLSRFEPLAHLPGVRLISLQKGHGTEQIEEFAGRFPIVELGSSCNEFSDTAAVMKSLDLVISADTSTAHLAGALGVPVWVPLPFAPDWRWLLERNDSPWYPTMRLFRQERPGEWDAVFERITAAVKAVREVFTRGVRSTSPRGVGR